MTIKLIKLLSIFEIIWMGLNYIQIKNFIKNDSEDGLIFGHGIKSLEKINFLYNSGVGLFFFVLYFLIPLTVATLLNYQLNIFVKPAIFILTTMAIGSNFAGKLYLLSEIKHISKKDNLNTNNDSFFIRLHFMGIIGLINTICLSLLVYKIYSFVMVEEVIILILITFLFVYIIGFTDMSEIEGSKDKKVKELLLEIMILKFTWYKPYRETLKANTILILDGMRELYLKNNKELIKDENESFNV